MKMIEQKTLRLSDRKSEISTTSSNFPSISKRNTLGINRTKTEAQIIRNTGKMSKNCIDNACSTTKSGQKETSERVQKSLNQISYPENSNPDKAMNSVNRHRKNLDFASCNNKSFQNNSNLRYGNKSNVKERDKYSNNFKLTQSASKKPESSRENKKKDDCRASKKDQTDKYHQMKFSQTPKTSDELKQIKTQNESSRSSENKKHKEVLKEPKNKLTDSSRKKPSEIPLRKTRMDASGKSKPVSMLLEKPVKEVESSYSIDFYSSAKPFLPIDEVSVCSELYITINAVSSSEKLDNIDTPVNSERPLIQENIYNTRLERSFKSPNLPTVGSIKSIDFLEEKSPTGKKTKLLDLEKVKTSSFTVLQSSPSVLNRLESLHKQNVLAKRKINGGNQNKPKPLTPKQFFHSIKRRSSRKSLFSNSNSIKNKSNMKLKLQKSDKEIQEDLYPPEKLIQLKVNTFKDLTAKKVIPDGREGGRRTVLNANQPEDNEECESLLPKSVRQEDKLLLQKMRSCREKERSKIPKSLMFSTQRARAAFLSQGTENSNKSNSVANEVESVVYLKSKTLMQGTPNLSPDQSQIKLKNRKHKEDAENLPKTVIMNESGVCSSSSRCVIRPREGVTTSGKTERRSTRENETVKAKNEFPVARDGEISEKQEDSNKKVKMQLKIDLNLQDSPEENSKNMNSCGWLFQNDIKEPPEELHKEEKVETILSNSLLSEWAKKTRNLSGAFLNLQETSKNCSLIKEKFFDKMSDFKTKKIKKKTGSDGSDRQLPSFNFFFTSHLPLQDKVKLDTEKKSNLAKCRNKNDRREIFEEEAAVKLRRRNSEPISLTGYIWKRTNFSFFRGDKPSMSSMASSLRHLNTDDVDDFIFWEPVPQKMTPCWEISLYQCKKPWSVLSCSVFRDNRLSNTPGQILENLRNGGNLNARQSARSNNERVHCKKENPFDVEPSIAQKNIDIRNWLAALNFPTSTPNVISEINFSSQSNVDSQNLNKAQVTPKRRKVLRNLKLLEKTAKGKNLSGGRNLKEEEGIRNLFRRKSGGYIVNELLNSKYLTHRLNMSPCLTSKSAEEKSLLVETDDRNTASESKVFKIQEFYCDSGTMVDENLACSSQLYINQPKIPKNSDFEGILIEKSKFISSEFNMWKYLFIFTIFITIIFYYFNSIIYTFIFTDYFH